MNSRCQTAPIARKSRGRLRLGGRHLPLLVAAVWLSCSLTPAAAADWKLPSIPGLPKLPQSPKAAAEALAPSTAPAAAINAADDLLQSRPYESVQALLAKGTVTGTDLVPELTALRGLMSKRRSASAMGKVLGSSEGGSSGGFDPKAEAMKASLKLVDDKIKPYVASIGFNALDSHMRTLLDDSSLLASESIKLPSGKGLTQQQAQRTVTMAAMIIGIRLTGKLLVKAKLDFAGVEDEYGQLIERREAAAKVLYDVLLKGGATGDLAEVYGDGELRYMRETLGKMSVADFAKDLGAQNLALAYLRKTDPNAWEDYKGKSEGVRKSTKGYIRTVAGVGAFAALMANFSQETLNVLRSKKGADIVLTMPLAFEFFKEVPALLSASWAAASAGVVELPMKASQRFRLVEGTSTEEFRNAGDLFAAVKKRNAEPLLAESLFRTGADGLLYKLYRCDKSEVGRMLDTAVSVGDREKFATDFALTEPAGFSFANSFNAPEPTPREQEMGDELLRKDHRQRSESRALGEAQRAATKGYSKWNNDQVLRLILANREGAAALATLQLGDVLVRPVPNMQSVYAYESLVDECAKQFGGGPAAKPAAAAPAPAAKPPAKKK